MQQQQPEIATMSEPAAAAAAPKSFARRDRLTANEQKVQAKWERENVSCTSARLPSSDLGLHRSL
jgi:hypothetical protein